MKLMYGLVWTVIVQLAVINFVLAANLSAISETNRLLEQNNSLLERTNSRLHDIDMSLFRLNLK